MAPPTPTTPPNVLHPPTEDEELIDYLELDQLVSGRRVPLPPAPVGPGLSAALWALRVFCLVVSVMVIYTFVAQL